MLDSATLKEPKEHRCNVETLLRKRVEETYTDVTHDSTVVMRSGVDVMA
jgi:hypothetical protein